MDEPWNDYTSQEQEGPWDNFKPSETKGNLLGSAKAAGKEFVAAADAVGGIAGFVFNAIETPIMAGEAAVMGSQTPFKDARTAMDNGFNNSKFGRFLNAPVSSTTGVSTEGTMVKGLFDDIGGIIDKTAAGATAANGNPEAGEAVKQIANLVMLKGGEVAIDSLKKIHAAAKKDPIAVANGNMPEDVLPIVKGADVTMKPPIEQFSTDVNGITRNDLVPTEKPVVKEAPVDDGYIPFEKVDPASLAPKQSEMFFDEPGMDFTTHATPEQGVNIISHVVTDTTPAHKGKPLGGTGKKGFGQGGAVAFDPEAIRKTIKDTFEGFKKSYIRTPEVLKATRYLDDELTRNKNMSIRDETNINKAYSELQMKAGLTPELDRKFIDVLENPNTHLSPEEQHVYNETVPYAQEYFSDALKAYNEVAGKHGEYDASIFPRFAIGKGGMIDRLLQASRTGQGPIIGNRAISPSSAKTRTTFALEHPDGRRQVITLGKDNTMTAWDNGKPTPIAKFDGPIKLGQELQGDNFDGAKIKQATFSEAQQHTDTKYFPSAVESLLRKGQELRAATRVLETVNKIKYSPEFSQMAMNADKVNVPDNWRHANINIPQLRNYKFEPNLAETLEDYAGNRLNNGAVKTLEMVQNGILKALFLWPLPHMNNEGAHWVPSRGLEGWFTPKGLKDLREKSGPAIQSVLQQDKIQREITEAGGQLMYPQVYNEYYWKDRLKSTLENIHTQPNFIRLAKDLALSPAKLVSKLSEYSNKSMWAVRDMMITELYLSEKQKNPERTPKELMTEIERHMPSYRIPNRVLGSRSIATVMKQPLLSVFSFYHYGMAKSFLEFGKSIAAPMRGEDINWRTAKQEFVNGASKAAMLGVMYSILYPAMDKSMEMITGVPGKFRRAGGLHLVEKILKVAKGKAPIQDLVRTMITPAPASQMAIEAFFNRDMFTGQHVNDNLKTYVPEKLSPLRTAGAVSSGKKSKKEAAMEYLLDYKAKTTNDLIKEATKGM